MLGKFPSLRRIVSDHDLERLVVHTATTSSHQGLHEALVIVATTGLRKRELADLRWSDIDLHQHRLVVGGRNHKTRQAFLNHETLAILLTRRQRNPDAEFVFGPTSANRLSRQLRLISQNLGIDCNFHMLRRTFATRLCNSGVGILTFCSLLGVAYPSGTEIIGLPGEATLRRASEGLPGI